MKTEIELAKEMALYYKEGKDVTELKNQLQELRKKNAEEFWRNWKPTMDDLEHVHLPNPLEELHYKVLYEAGVLRKEQLLDGKYYRGRCRNATVAQWNEKENCFWYMRHKFGAVFAEKINHLQDDDFTDLFFPLREIEPDEDQIIKR